MGVQLILALQIGGFLEELVANLIDQPIEHLFSFTKILVVLECALYHFAFYFGFHGLELLHLLQVLYQIHQLRRNLSSICRRLVQGRILVQLGQV